MASKCFVIMPFRPELAYMYRFVKSYVEQTFEIECERADGQVLTNLLIDKIRDMIDEADFFIADISGLNPNVFYELGMAHAADKPVIIITHEAIDDVPTDIKAYQFIRYTDNTEDFITRLGSAIRSIVGGDFDELHEAAQRLFVRFREAAGLPLQEAPKEEFLSKATAGRSVSKLPAPNDEHAVARTLVLPMVAEGINADIAAAYGEWLEQHYPLEEG